MSNKKIILSLILVIALTFSGICYGDSFQGNSLQDNGLYVYSVNAPQEVTEAAQTEFENLIAPAILDPDGYGFDKNEVNDLYLGKGFNLFVYDEDGKVSTDSFCFLIMYEDTVRGKLEIGLNNDGTCSGTLSSDFADELENLSNITSKNSPIRLAAIDTALIAVNENENVIVDPGLNDNISNEQIKQTISNSEIQSLDTNIDVINIKEPISTSRCGISASRSSKKGSSANKTLDVKIVGQGDTTWCWAASAACIINYKDNSKITAKDVVDAVDNGNSGTQENIEKSYECFNYKAEVYAPFEMSDVITYIDDDCPLQMLAATEKKDRGHSVVIRGYRTSSSGAGLSIMDPGGEGSFRSVSASDSPEKVYFKYNGAKFYWVGTVYAH